MDSLPSFLAKEKKIRYTTFTFTQYHLPFPAHCILLENTDVIVFEGQFLQCSSHMINCVKLTWVSVTTRREVIVSEGWAEGLWGDSSTISSEGVIRRGWTKVMAWIFQSHCPNIPGGIWAQCPTSQLVERKFYIKQSN